MADEDKMLPDVTLHGRWFSLNEEELKKEWMTEREGLFPARDRLQKVLLQIAEESILLEERRRTDKERGRERGKRD